jgi:hypothetical protein
MGWLDELADHGKKQIKEPPKAPKKRLAVHEVTITLRGASGDDPGSIAAGFYVVDGDTVFLTDVNGEIGKDAKGHAVGDCDPRYIAQMLLRQRRAESNEDFNRRLDYRRTGWA